MSCPPMTHPNVPQRHGLPVDWPQACLAEAESAFERRLAHSHTPLTETLCRSVSGDTHSRLILGALTRDSVQSIQPSSAQSPPLEAEVEISVRPSGRKWLPLPSLSGGERSLSAIAILFSLLKIRPSPFCFLDEVDAALDDANIGRFANMLKDFSLESQIIVITHNKRTMAVADNIYGVTMEEPGTSKVISMKLTEAAK